MPVIAITRTSRMADYVEAIRRAGGTPDEVAPQAEDPAAIVARAGGIVLTGGADVDPALYGEPPHPTYRPAETGRDAFEVALARAAVAADRPLLAICRGMQVLNVACGGSLVQDIPSQVTAALPHFIGTPRNALAHEVWVVRDSRLWAMLVDRLEGESLPVNSRHHQAVGGVAPGFAVSATAPDGIIEAIERPASRFCAGVQWHPENFWRTGEFRSLFEHFVRAARLS